ncbi:MAG: hypothetical protein FWH51_00360 [Dehalococcoidia bacterium]|nr:hypothetical protein [Dehalococcoidia bacterium]
MEKQPARKYPQIGVCELNRGLCPQTHTMGISTCARCDGDGFLEKHPACGILAFARRHKLEVCDEYSRLISCLRICLKFVAANAIISFMSCRRLLNNLESIRRYGLAAMVCTLKEKVAFLRWMISVYDDDRSKGFYCLCAQLLPAERSKLSLALAEQQMSTKLTARQRAALVQDTFGEMAEDLGAKLKLRRKKTVPSAI